MKHASDDPRLTAYLLGELDPAEAAALEAALAEDPVMQAELEALRATGARLSAALAAEASAFAAEAGPGLSESRRAALLAEATQPARAPIPWRARITPFRALAAAVAVLLLGAFATRVNVGDVYYFYQSTQEQTGHDSASRGYQEQEDVTLADLLARAFVVAGESAPPPAAESAAGAPAAALPFDLDAGDMELAQADSPAGSVDPRLAPYMSATSQPEGAVEGESLAAADALSMDEARADPGRKVIKNADMTMTVRDIPLSLGRIGSLAAQLGGYVTETRHDQSGAGNGEALVAFAVPAERFEEALDRLRGMAVSVVQEQASGQDVSQAYVDLQSEIANLEATRARIRSFLDQAQTVEESLQVNAQLAEIEGQIAERRGRLEHLAQRSAYSTITVRLFPAPPEQSPTPMPTATPVVWSAAAVAKQASSTLTILLQAAATLLIWTVIVVVPFAIPVALIAAAARRRQAR